MVLAVDDLDLLALKADLDGLIDVDGTEEGEVESLRRSALLLGQVADDEIGDAHVLHVRTGETEEARRRPGGMHRVEIPRQSPVASPDVLGESEGDADRSGCFRVERRRAQLGHGHVAVGTGPGPSKPLRRRHGPPR